MAEINLNTRLRNNPHAAAIISIITHLNAPYIRETIAGPFQALAVARILAERSLNWNNGPSLRAAGFTATTACVDGCDPKGGFCISGWGPCPSPAPCPGQDTCGPSVTGASAINAITALAVDSGLEDPYTPPVTAFLSYMEGINMSAVNAYVFFQQIVDEFYKNVSFISFFTNRLKEGLYADGITQLIGGNFRFGFRPTGLTIETVSDGSPGDKAYTDIFIGETGNPGDVAGPAPYFTIFDSVNSEQVFWMRIGGSYEQPVVPAGVGVVQTYNVIDLATNTPQTDIANTLASSIAGTGVFDNITIIADVVKVTANEAGSQTQAGQADLTAPGGGLPNVGKSFTFTPGTDSSGEKVTLIDYRTATAKNLIGTWFKMYNANDDGVLFIYETPANPVNPDSLGVAYTTAVAINISANGPEGGCYQAAGGVSFVCPPKSVCIDGECIYNAEGIEAVTTR
jgi:hypothetical protein